MVEDCRCESDRRLISESGQRSCQAPESFNSVTWLLRKPHLLELPVPLERQAQPVLLVPQELPVLLEPPVVAVLVWLAQIHHIRW